MLHRFPRLVMCASLHTALAAFALGGLTAPAQAACLDRETVSAARVHEFGTMMMVVSLRCRTMGYDLRPAFDSMMRTHQAPFGKAANRLRAYLGETGHEAHSGRFDHFATLVANRYGGGSSTAQDCQSFGQVAGQLAHQSDGIALEAAASAMVEHPLLDDGLCPEH